MDGFEISSPDVKRVQGTIGGHEFEVMLTMTDNYSPITTGLHISYGHRFIRHEQTLGGKRLPNQFYAIVSLGKSWKDCLSSDKTAIIQYRDELYARLAEICEPWIHELSSLGDEGRLETLMEALGRKTAEIFVLDPKKEGEFKAGGEERGNVLKHEGSGSLVDIKNERVARAIDGGAEAREKRQQRRHLPWKYKTVDDLGKMPFAVVFEEEAIVVQLNKAFAAISSALSRPFKMANLWPFVVAAVVHDVRENSVTWDARMENLEELVGASRDDAHFDPYLFGWLLEREPEVEEPEVEPLI